MKEDDSEPHLRRLLVLSIIIIFCLGSVAAAQTPIIKDKPGMVSKKKINTISGYFKPSIKGTGYSYTWHYKSFINYCPYCKTYNTLMINPKGVPEKEISCWKKVKNHKSKCGADFDGTTGIVKNGHRNKRLTKG